MIFTQSFSSFSIEKNSFVNFFFRLPNDDGGNDSFLKPRVSGEDFFYFDNKSGENECEIFRCWL